MEQSPKIIMQCPKCKREFPEDVSYCETCSVMLEPVEVEAEKPVTPEPEPAKPEGIKHPAGDTALPEDEKIEDVKIDTLKADIENKFVCTLLQERVQLKRRLTKKEKALSDFRGKGGGADNELKAREIEDIAAKIARGEAILENLKKKIEGDISNLRSQLSGIETPGLLWFMNDKGKYHRMLSLELRTKETLFDIVSGKKSPNYFSFVKLGRFALAFAVIIIPVVLLSGYFHKTEKKNSVLSQVQGLAATNGISGEKDIFDLLEDIKRANISKDISLWESRYSKGYLGMGDKKEKQLDLWNKFDFKSLKYKTENINVQPDKAGALITWDMELVSKQKKETKAISQRLYADFIIEEGKLKISSIRKEGQ